MAEGPSPGRDRRSRVVLVALVFFALFAWSAIPGPSTARTRTHVESPLSGGSLPDLTVDDATVAEGDSGTTDIVFRVHLSGSSLAGVTVLAATIEGGTASAGDLDFSPASQVLTFLPGSVAESLVVHVNGDHKIERDERFEVQLSAAQSAGIADSLATGTIANDDWAILSLDDAARAEGDSSTTVLWFTARLSEPSLEPVTMNVLLQDSTATVADGDYSATAPPLTIPPGFTSGSIPVTLQGDTKVELDEWFRVRLTNVVGAVLGRAEAVGGIQNDDFPVLSIADTSIVEGNAGESAMTFRVRLTPPATAPVTFRYGIVDRTARADDDDFLAISGDTLFTAGQDQIVFSVPIYGDTLLEGNEVFSFRIFAVVGAMPNTETGLGVIRNDERASFERVLPNVSGYPAGTLPPSFGDVDGDGRPDLPLYLNSEAGFVEMPGIRTLLGTGNYHGSAWCDYDRDGDMDLVQMPYANNSSPYNFTHLLENTPSGLQEVGQNVGMDIVGFGETPTWGDFNADGWPDLFLPFYSHVAPFRSYFFVNLGNGQFAERADSAGIALRNIAIYWRPEGVAVADWNGDGSLDFYCASHLFLNDGNAHFHDVRAQVGLPQVFDEGANFVDYDDDGDFDLYLRTSRGPTLYRNDGGTFSDATATFGLPNIDWEWGDRWADLDGDGDLDLLYFPPYAVARLLLNEGDGTFREDTEFTGVLSGHDLASFADLDSDGDIDIGVGAYGRQFARNRGDLMPGQRTSWLKVRVEDDDGMLVAHGAAVRLRSLDDPRHPVQSRIVDGGSGYLGQDEYPITFGGVGSGAFDLEVSYPSLPGSPRIVGPAQNPLLAGIRPSATGPQLLVVRPNGVVTVHQLSQDVAGVADLPINTGTLRPAVPNPARSVTRFYFSVPGDAPVSLEILDLSGRRIRRLLHEGHRSDQSSAAWDLNSDSGRPVPAGLYFARLRRGGRTVSTQRVAVVR